MKIISSISTFPYIVLVLILVTFSNCKDEEGNATDYQGGKIAYIFQPGDSGYVAGETHGIIAAPWDQSLSIQWYNGTDITTGAIGYLFGAGNENTNTIVATLGDGSYAAKLCYDLVLGGYSDWYLPGMDELEKLYLNHEAIGGFSSRYYWSSTESTALTNSAWCIDFWTGNKFFLKKSTKMYVRAVRVF